MRIKIKKNNDVDFFSGSDTEPGKPNPKPQHEIKEPKSSNKKKSKPKKRFSEPPTSSQPTDDGNEQKDKNDDDNLLDFFASMGPEVTQPEKDDDPFGFFKGVPEDKKPTEASNNNNRPAMKNTNSSPPINIGMKNNTNDNSTQASSRTSVNSETTQDLFDPAMWNDFAIDDKTINENTLNVSSNGRTNKAKSTPIVQPIRENKNTPTLAVVQETKGKKEDEGNDSSEESDNDSDSNGNGNGNGNSKDTNKKSNDQQQNKSNNNEGSNNTNNTSKKKTVNDKKPTNAIEELHRGTALLKYPRRHGFPHFKHVQLSKDNKRLQWFSKRKQLNETCIYIKDIKEILKGQETETFKKYHQKALEKASFSIVHSNTYKTLDLVAKSTDECEMWVKSLILLLQMVRESKDVSKITELDVGVKFRDRNRPRSRRGSGHFVRANNSKSVKIDPIALKQIEKDMELLHRNFQRTAQASQRPAITKSDEFHNIQQVLAELEERIEELTHEVANTRDTEMSKRDVWRATVDLTAITEKVEVLLKTYGDNGSNRNSLKF